MSADIYHTAAYYVHNCFPYMCHIDPSLLGYLPGIFPIFLICRCHPRVWNVTLTYMLARLYPSEWWRCRCPRNHLGWCDMNFQLSDTKAYSCSQSSPMGVRRRYLVSAGLGCNERQPFPVASLNAAHFKSRRNDKGYDREGVLLASLVIQAAKTCKMEALRI